MSGGSHDYLYAKILNTVDNMYDEDMDEIIKDIAKVLKELEWWQSSDTSESDYRSAVNEFKSKWLRYWKGWSVFTEAECKKIIKALPKKHQASAEFYEWKQLYVKSELGNYSNNCYEVGLFATKSDERFTVLFSRDDGGICKLL